MFDQSHCQICYQGSSCRCFGGPKKNKGEVKSVVSMIVVSLLFVGAFFHVITWNTHSINVVMLKSKSLLGLSTAQNHKTMANICYERKMFSCTEVELKNAVKKDEKDTDTWANLGELQHRMGKSKEAIVSLESYQALGGTSLEARYALAKAYMVEKKSEKAIETLTHMIKEKPQTLQVTVTRSYVEALMQANKWKKAKQIIEKTRGHSASFNLFMNAEYRAVMSKVGGRNLASH